MSRCVVGSAKQFGLCLCTLPQTTPFLPSQTGSPVYSAPQVKKPIPYIHSFSFILIHLAFDDSFDRA